VTRTARLCLVVGAAAVLAVVAAGPGTGAATTPPNATVDHDGDVLTLEAAHGQTITGTTTLEPGASISLRLRSTGESPFLRTVETTTDENGGFVGQVDLDGVPQGTPFELAVLHDGETLTTQTGVVTTCQRDCEPTATGTETPDGPDDPPRTVTDDWPSEQLWLAESIVFTTQGRTVTIPINVDDAPETPDSATITIGSESVNYVITATVRDTSGDGRVALLFNAGNAGFDAPTLAVEGNDELAVRSETSLSAPLDPADYDISVYRYDSTDTEVDVGTLVVSEAVNGTVTPGTRTATRATSAAFTTVGDRNESTSTTPLEDAGLLGVVALAAGAILAVLGVAVMLGLLRS
jgi:hypothetical protein